MPIQILRTLVALCAVASSAFPCAKAFEKLQFVKLETLAYAVESNNKLTPTAKRVLYRLITKSPDFFQQFDEAKRLTDRLRQNPEAVNRAASNVTGDNPTLHTMASLVAARGSIKDLVWRNGTQARDRLEAIGGDMRPLFNIFSSQQSIEALDQSLRVLNDAGRARLSAELFKATGYTFQEFKTDPTLHEIFADQVIAVVRNELGLRSAKLPAGHPQIAVISDLLNSLNADRSGDLSFSLGGRDAAGFMGGNQAGDCTAVGSMNYWTQGAWNSTIENNELQVHHKGKFFARLIFVAGTSMGEPVIWVHAAEFTPLSRPGKEANTSRLSDKDLQKEIFKHTLQYLADRAKRSGMKDVFVTGISNSFGFVDSVKPIVDSLVAEDKSGGTALEPRSFSMLTPVDSSHRLLDSVEGPHPERAIPIYFQGWPGGSGFQRTGSSPIERASPSRVAPYGEQQIRRADLDIASRLVQEVVRNELAKHSRSIESIVGRRPFKESMRSVLLSESPGKEGAALFRHARDSLGSIARSLDPASAEQIVQRLTKLETDMVAKFRGIEIVPTQEEARVMKLFTKALKRLSRQHSMESTDQLVKLARKRAIRMAKEGEGEDDEPSVQDFNRMLEFLPELEATDPRFMAKWLRNYREAALDQHNSGIDQWYARRPNALRETALPMQEAIASLSRMDGTIPGPAIVEVLERANPQFKASIREALREAAISPESRALIEAHPGPALQFYMDESQYSNQSLHASASAMSSNVNTLSLRNLME